MVRGFGFATSGFQQGVFAGARGIGRFVAWPWHPHMIQVKPTIVELDMDKLEEILRRLDAKELDADDYGTIKAVIGAYVHLYHLVGDIGAAGTPQPDHSPTQAAEPMSTSDATPSIAATAADGAAAA